MFLLITQSKGLITPKTIPIDNPFKILITQKNPNYNPIKCSDNHKNIPNDKPIRNSDKPIIVSDNPFKISDNPIKYSNMYIKLF